MILGYEFIDFGLSHVTRRVAAMILILSVLYAARAGYYWYRHRRFGVTSLVTFAGIAVVYGCYLAFVTRLANW